MQKCKIFFYEVFFLIKLLFLGLGFGVVWHVLFLVNQEFGLIISGCAVIHSVTYLQKERKKKKERIIKYFKL